MHRIKTIKIAVSYVCLQILVGCSSTPDHSNTLVFGTETKFAVDVATSTTTQVPAVTVGYKRTEAIWLPLLANKKVNGEFEPADCKKDSDNETCLFKSTEKNDAYSVLASFGATFGGEGEADASTPTPTTEGEATQATVKGSTKASGGIAQYFATGRAAQILAEKGGASVVSVQSGNAKPEKTTEEVLMEKFNLSPEQVKKIIKEANEQQTKNEVIVDLVMERLAPKGTIDTTKTAAVVTELKKVYAKLGSVDDLGKAADSTAAKNAVIKIVATDPRDGEKAPRDAILEQSLK